MQGFHEPSGPSAGTGRPGCPPPEAVGDASQRTFSTSWASVAGMRFLRDRWSAHSQKPLHRAEALGYHRGGLPALVVMVLVLRMPVEVVEIVHVVAVLDGVVSAVLPVGVLRLGVLCLLVVVSHDDALDRRGPRAGPSTQCSTGPGHLAIPRPGASAHEPAPPEWDASDAAVEVSQRALGQGPSWSGCPRWLRFIVSVRRARTAPSCRVAMAQ